MLSGRRVRADLVGADLDAGFALVRLAEKRGTPEASRALREAEDALLEGRRRSAMLKGDGRAQFRSRLDELRDAIDRAKSRCTARRRPPAKILRMP